MSPHIVRITTAGFVLAALLSTTVVGTTIVGLRRKAAVIITADSKANYRGRAGASEVCKILRTGQTYFAIAGLDHDVLRGTFFQQTIADAFQDIDPFATRIEKVERALKADVLREMIAVQQQDPETYEWIRKDSPNVLSVLLADFENGQPHLAARAFEFVPGSTPDVRVANCDFLTSPGFCYMGKSPEGIHNFGEILKLDPTDPERPISDK